jgi:hypothetical protein
MLRMGVQIGTGLEMVIVKLQVKMVSLKISENEDAGNSSGKFSEAIENILSHQRHTLLKLIAMDLSAATNACALLPCPRRTRVKRSTRSKLPLGEGFYSCPHVWVVGWAVTFINARQTCRIGKCPALVGVVAKT